MADIAVVVLFWNGEQFVEPLMRSIKRQTLAPVEIIAVDNGSTDDSIETARRVFPDLRVIETGKNLGFAGGMNVGIAAASAPVVVLLNQDVVLDGTCLEEISKAFDEDASIGAVGCKILFPDRLTLQHAGGYLEQPLALGQHYGYSDRDDGQYDNLDDVEYVNAAVIGLRKSALDAVGTLDERFFPGYYEEVDLCRRLRESGWRVVYRSGAVAIHHESASLGKNSPRYYAAFHRSRLRYVLKYTSIEDFAVFVEQEAERHATLSEPEQNGLCQTYRELAEEAKQLRPELSGSYDRLLTIPPPVPDDKLTVNGQRFFAQQAAEIGRMLDEASKTLDPRASVYEPTGFMQRLIWKLIRPAIEPVLLDLEAHNRAMQATVERIRDHLDWIYLYIDFRGSNQDALEADARQLRLTLGEAAARIDDLEGIVVSADGDLSALRREIALLQYALRDRAGRS